MLLAADAAAPGWAHLVGLLIAAAIAVLGIGTHQWRLSLQDPSPTPPQDGEEDVTPGETYDPDTDDTTRDTADDTGWWGQRVRLPDGSTVVRQHRALDDVVDEPDDEDEETREEMADRLVREGGAYTGWVRELMGAHDVSESTAKIEIRKARQRIGA